MGYVPKWGDHEYDLLFKSNESLAGLVSNYMQPNVGDHKYDLLFKLASNIAGLPGSGTTPQVVATPSGINDFSGLPGGVAPTSGVYFAPRDIGTLWTIEAGDTQWTVIEKNNP